MLFLSRFSFFLLNLQSNVTENVSLLDEMDFKHGKYFILCALASVSFQKAIFSNLPISQKYDFINRGRLENNFIRKIDNSWRLSHDGRF